MGRIEEPPRRPPAMKHRGGDSWGRWTQLGALEEGWRRQLVVVEGGGGDFGGGGDGGAGKRRMNIERKGNG